MVSCNHSRRLSLSSVRPVTHSRDSHLRKTLCNPPSNSSSHCKPSPQERIPLRSNHLRSLSPQGRRRHSSLLRLLAARIHSGSPCSSINRLVKAGRTHLKQAWEDGSNWRLSQSSLDLDTRRICSIKFCTTPNLPFILHTDLRAFLLR